MVRTGSLVCVGIGMTLGSHFTPLARSYISKADVVFTGLSDGIIELWLAKMNSDVRSLQPLYREGKPRSETYQQMVDTMLSEVRACRQGGGAGGGRPGGGAGPARGAGGGARGGGGGAHME